MTARGAAGGGNTHVRSRGPAWWTEADATELALFVHELVRVAFAHRERCPTCQERAIACSAPMGEAIAAKVEWRDGQVLRSKSAWLPMRQQASEELAAA
jgi:hypothetical protein